MTKDFNSLETVIEEGIMKFYASIHKLSSIYPECTFIKSELFYGVVHLGDCDRNIIFNYLKGLESVLTNFKDSPYTSEIAIINQFLFTMGESDFSVKINNLISKNRFNDNLKYYINLPLQAITLENITPESDLDYLDKTLLILEKYDSVEFKGEVYSVLKLILNKIEEGDFHDSVDFLPMLLEGDLEILNEKEAKLYHDTIKENFATSNLITLIYDSRDYENIKIVDICPFMDYCLKIKNNIDSELKYSLNMKQIKTMMETYDLLEGTSGRFSKLFLPARDILFQHLNQVMEIGDTESAKINNTMSFCYDVQRLIKKDASNGLLLQQLMIRGYN
ncbi:hypothetical protein HN385_03430 [archaeon]|jgi:hypothetical protein|nr:hypothetical protein [archaeon]MBT3450683.1 hypothetical protein [archaeon]MBT6869748.1 hypothetical protein [archaeon]MBT7192703.1 hypothetical protein [archaeon]MBT7380728.1 hypothetical protein [archaeon]